MPSAISRSLIARPMPRVPPVTTAVLAIPASLVARLPLANALPVDADPIGHGRKPKWSVAVFNIEARANLAEFADLFDVVVRDASFFTTGKIPTRSGAKLVPVGAEKHLPELMANLDDIAAVICPAELVEKIPEQLGVAVSASPLAAQYRVHVRLCDRPDYFWTGFETRIDPSARVHPTAWVAPRDVEIGAHTVIDAHAVVMPRTIIGAECFIGANTTLGSEAFETTKVDGRDRLQRQAGGVKLGEAVIFLSNCAVARSVFPVFTEIGDGCGFDNLVHVAHDCLLEKGVKLTACSMLAGRVEMGEGSYVGPNATVSNGVSIGRKGYVTIGATVVRDVADETKVTGNFAIEHSRFIRNLKESVR
jgi:UDP-3-O-[3-hydroxymyristoyl] glucosamine N-acyltransferase